MQSTSGDVLDVAIVGAGPAGLSAALLLGRCRRRVVVVDDGRPRNRASRGVHGFLTRDRTPPAELLRIAREQLALVRLGLAACRPRRGERGPDRCGLAMARASLVRLSSSRSGCGSAPRWPPGSGAA